MCEEILIRHCSPTLAGIKTASLINISYESEEEMSSALEKFNTSFSGKGLKAVSLKYSQKRALIYIYRPSKLAKDWEQPSARTILMACGYRRKNLQLCVERLAKKLETGEDFPHEIGIFLGYPPEDVSCFMAEKCGMGLKKCKCMGAWKVYENAENAKKTFSMYEKCKNIYYKQWMCGKSIERLIVAV